MSTGEREPGVRWPGMKFLRRCDTRQHRAQVKHLLRSGRYDDVARPYWTSAKWQVW